MNALPIELLIVVPVYNEEASVAAVLGEWFPVVAARVARFRFLVIDDGSTDETRPVLDSLCARYGERLEIASQPNRGHGQTCLEGYRAALARGVPFVLQIDSDGQCDPRFFAALWARRTDCDVVYGQRTRRDDGWRRVLASVVVRLFLLGLFRVNCVDANVPYRLMRTAALGPALARIPPDFALANVALAVLLKRDARVRHGSVPIRFRARTGGEPSVRLGRFGSKAVELYRQIREMLRAPLPAGRAAESPVVAR